MRELFSLVVLVSCAYSASFAQTPSPSPISTFKGIVTDSYGAAIKHASVLVEAEKVVATLRAASKAQEFLPSPPQDRSLIYILDEQNKLVPLPFEQGLTSLHADAIARSTKIGYIELKGEHAGTLLSSTTPRLFLFTYQRPGVHPPFLVWLTPHRGARRVTAVTQKGLRGFAIASEEIIKPVVRVLAPAGDQVFMEVHPRASLVPGEYAIIGDDLARLATFRIGEAAPP